MDAHVTDDLELYVLGALDELGSERIAGHLADCPACRAQAADLAGTVEALAGTSPGREPPAALRARILASASDDPVLPAARREIALATRARRAAPILALAAAVTLLLGIDILNVSQLRAAEAERADYTATLDKVSRGGKAWYMAGLERWAGSGGTLFAPGASNKAPFVVFHDLQAAPAGSLYTLWLVDADGKWVRGANFTPNGRVVQTVDLDVPVAGFDRCALTLETRIEGKREGPVVMQSRLAPPAQ